MVLEGRNASVLPLCNESTVVHKLMAVSERQRPRMETSLGSRLYSIESFEVFEL